MNRVFKDAPLAKSSLMSAARPGMNRAKVFCTADKLRDVAIVAFQYAAEFGLATNNAFRPGNKSLVQNSIVSTNTTMRAMLVIMFEPHAKNVVKLSSAEAD